MKLAKKFTVGMLLRFVPCIKIQYQKVYVTLVMALQVSIVLIKKNTISTCQENERQQTPSPFMNKIMLDRTL